MSMCSGFSRLVLFLALSTPACAAPPLPPLARDNQTADAPPVIARPGAPKPPAAHVASNAAVPAPDATPPNAAPEMNPAPDAHALPSPPPLTESEVALEAGLLRAAMNAEVPQSRHGPLTGEPNWIHEAHLVLAHNGRVIDRPQLIVMVDRSPKVQSLRILLARPGDQPWEMIGGTHVSTGQTGRFDHYITPIGVFPHDGGIIDFRAEGTFNENHIRGYGLKGMRIWDFGWQTAAKGWWDGQSGPMRLLMHATDPSVLEQRIGARASSGCVRIPAALNTFMDKHGVLDYDYERMSATDKRVRWVLRSDRTPTKLAGDMMIVIDSSEKPST